MNSCKCGGELLRHGKTFYKGTDIVGVRYKCKECGKTFTERMEADSVNGRVFFNTNGRPTMKDWRFSTSEAS